MDEFVAAANEVFPGVCVHFEDWNGTDATRLLARYSDKVLCCNDDIQGTASVAIAGLTTALQISGTKLKDQTILFLGAGSAGIAIANMIVEAMVDEGLKKEDAQKQIVLFDINGLVVTVPGHLAGQVAAPPELLSGVHNMRRRGKPLLDAIYRTRQIMRTNILGTQYEPCWQYW